MAHYRITLTGPDVRGARVSAALLRDLLDVLVEGTRRAVRLRVEGRSTVRGTPPAWLAAAAAFDVVGLDEGSTVIELEAESLDRALDAESAQVGLFEEFDTERTGLALLAESVGDALAGNVESDRYDHGLLEKIEEFGRTLERGVGAIGIVPMHPTTLDREVTIHSEALENVKRLRLQTPPDQSVRVAGRLNVIRHSDRMFALILDSGVTLRGVAEGLPSGKLAEFFGEQVVVSGTAAFRPSGRVQTINAEQIEPAGEDSAIWAAEPRPLFAELPSQGLVREQGPRSGINAVIGAWPGDESDSEMERLLEELS